MNKYLKWGLIILGIGVFLMIASTILRFYTKSHSPQEEVVYSYGESDCIVYYSRPYKKDRVIFGELVPYDEVWRTGANEPTVFTSTGEIEINGQALNPGEYSLWTIPGINQWRIIWNSEMPDWGISAFDGKALRDPNFDVVVVDVPVEKINSIIEQFTIELNSVGLSLSWDQTKVTIPINK